MASGRRSWKMSTIVASLAATALCSGQAHTSEEGEALFVKDCLVCHTVEKGGEKRQGPNLWAVIGRTAGSIVGFPYSSGLKDADWPWTPETLDGWLEDPHAVVSDTYMIYRQANREVRHKIIAYLQTKTD